MSIDLKSLIKRLRNPDYFVQNNTGVYYNVGGLEQLCKEAADALSIYKNLDPIILRKEDLDRMEGRQVMVRRMGCNDPSEFAVVKSGGDCVTDNGDSYYNELYGSSWVAFLLSEDAS